MSATVGTVVPDQLARLFDGTDLAAKLGLGFLMVTVDPDGRPRPCLLSCGEVLVTSPTTVRLAVWAGTGTARNLSHGSTVLFCFIAEGTVCYLRGWSRPLGVAPALGLECVELLVESVQTDSHDGLPVTGGVSFAVAEPDPDSLLASWAAQLAALRAATAG
jgi:hypothetical protein